MYEHGGKDKDVPKKDAKKLNHVMVQISKSGICHGRISAEIPSISLKKSLVWPHRARGIALPSAFAQAHRAGRTPAGAQPDGLDAHHQVGGWGPYVGLNGGTPKSASFGWDLPF